MRDYQRQRAYDAEFVVRGRLQKDEATVGCWGEAQDWLMELHATCQRDLGVTFDLEVKASKKRAYCRQWTWQHMPLEIYLPAQLGSKQSQYRPWWMHDCARYSLLLHEYAHAMTASGQGHGPVWVGVFLELLKNYHPEGPGWWHDLRHEYYWAGVEGTVGSLTADTDGDNQRAMEDAR